MSSTTPTRILILGGGFGGVYTALTLERVLRRELKRGEVEIALVSRDNYLTFQPMLPEVVSGSIGILEPGLGFRRGALLRDPDGHGLAAGGAYSVKGRREVARELLAERHARAVQPRLDGRHGLAEDPGGLLVREFLDIAQDQYGPIGLG